MQVRDRKDGEKVLVLGHRGSLSREVENTISSFKRAIDEGADGIELDVHLSIDGELIVIHDPTTKRVFGPDRRISEMTVKEIKEISHQIPTLEEVFSAMGNIYYDIEIKSEYSVDKELIRTLTKCLNKHPELQDKIIVSSFHPLAMRAFQKLNGNKYPLGAIYEGPETTLPVFLQKGQGRFIFHADYLKPKWDIATREKHSKMKYPIVPWGVDTKDSLRKMLEIKAPIVITNEPELIVKALQEEGLH